MPPILARNGKPEKAFDDDENPVAETVLIICDKGQTLTKDQQRIINKLVETQMKIFENEGKTEKDALKEDENADDEMKAENKITDEDTKEIQEKNEANVLKTTSSRRWATTAI